VRAHGACAPERGRRPRHEVADIFRAHGETYRATHSLTAEQRKVVWCIQACRTSVLGGHVEVCKDCGHKEPSYSSCRNRHCPKCQALDQRRWLEKQRGKILPVPYFHVVFTLPSELRPLARRNPKLIYDLLFSTASRTLLDLGRDPKRLGALLGITGVLHTWTRDLRFHPHLHCVVTGGGLHLVEDRWVDSGPLYLFPVQVIGKLFRGKFLAGLDRLHRKGHLDIGESEQPREDRFPELRDKLYRKKWVVYAKRPFAGPEQVFIYLGRYTHRVAISNHRIVSFTDDAVTIDTRDGKTATLKPEQFIGRFLMHVLPPGFVKIRHYGLMASSHAKGKYRVARQLLADRFPSVESVPNDNGLSDADVLSSDWREAMKQLTGFDPALCRSCGGSRLRSVSIPAQRRPQHLRSRAPPHQRER
jgi:hypothetical protein